MGLNLIGDLGWARRIGKLHQESPGGCREIDNGKPTPEKISSHGLWQGEHCSLFGCRKFTSNDAACVAFCAKKLIVFVVCISGGESDGSGFAETGSEVEGWTHGYQTAHGQLSDPGGWKPRLGKEYLVQIMRQMLKRMKLIFWFLVEFPCKQRKLGQELKINK